MPRTSSNSPIFPRQAARPAEPPRLLGIAAAAERLDIREGFLRRLIAERRIPYVKVGRYIKIPTADIDAFIAAHRHEATNR